MGFAYLLITVLVQTEVNYLGQLHHPNLVKLIGYCLDGENRLLVYEFMPKGSLENHLFRSKQLAQYDSLNYLIHTAIHLLHAKDILQEIL